MSVSLSDIVMQYPGTRALDGVSVDFRFGEMRDVHVAIAELLGGSRERQGQRSGTDQGFSVHLHG